MMKSVTLALLLGLMFIAPIGLYAADGWTGNINLTLGKKSLDDFDWDPVDNHDEIGIDVDFRNREWPINIVIALLASEEDDDFDIYDIEGSTRELRLGVRKIWEPGQTMQNMRPFFGGGLVLIDAEYEIETSGQRVSDDDSGLGFWFEGGIYWTLSTRFNLGFNIGYSNAEVDFFGSDIEAGGAHAGLILGYHY